MLIRFLAYVLRSSTISLKYFGLTFAYARIYKVYKPQDRLIVEKILKKIWGEIPKKLLVLKDNNKKNSRRVKS